jgi:hypothetical protein
MYTNDRVSDFSRIYKDYLSKLKKQSNTPGGSDDSGFQYYNFIVSPDAINLTDIGRCLSSDVLKLKSSYDDHILWQTMPGANTPQGWKLELGKTVSSIKRREQGLSSESSDVKSTLAGLQCKITLLSSNPDDKDNDYVDNLNKLGVLSNAAFLDRCVTREQGNESTAWIDRFSNDSKVVFSSLTTDFSKYNKLFTETVDVNKYAVGVEWFGYFKPPTLGEYKFAINSGSGFCLLWIGNKAICEYVPENADINIQSNPLTKIIGEAKYYPIRIQYYANTNVDVKNPRDFSFTVTNTKNLAQLNLKESLFTVNEGKYLPKLLYCAFVSRSLESFRYGKFDCYTMRIDEELDDDISIFYKFINSQKYNFLVKQYDYDNVSGVSNVGTLKDGVKYTDAADATNSNATPIAFSIYRLDSDIRMNQVFQIKTTNDSDPTAPYEINVMQTDFAKGKSYDTFPNFYPSDPSQGVNIKGPNECKARCNALPDCNYFYTYESNKVSRCLVGTNNAHPEFSQIRPIGDNANSTVDEATSSLYIRTLNFPKASGCGNNAVLLASDQDVKNTMDYSDSFAYANYILSPNIIKTHKEVGRCADSEFVNLETEARNILYANKDYQEDGSYLRTDKKIGLANYPSSDDKKFWNNIKLETFTTNREGMDTNAIADTHDGIAGVLSKDQKFAGTQMAIHKNFIDLSNNLLPSYFAQRSEMNNNVNSDLSGNVLLYFRNQRIPTLIEQTSFDANETGFMQRSLYVLGTMTAVSLLILAVLIARD